ncbi:hypothetical protein J5I95_13790 [Candidatus Poribacteria bacterium]|nr:hypothetical protein [Candidatus Poribacteria bacterium]
MNNNGQLHLRIPDPNTDNALWKFYHKDTDELVLSSVRVFFGTRAEAEGTAKRLSKQRDIECEARKVDLFDI